MPSSKTAAAKSKKASSAEEDVKKGNRGKSAGRSIAAASATSASSAKNSKAKSASGAGKKTGKKSSAKSTAAKGKTGKAGKDGKTKRARALLDLDIDDVNAKNGTSNNDADTGEDVEDGTTRKKTGRSLRARKKVRYEDDVSVGGDDDEVSVFLVSLFRIVKIARSDGTTAYSTLYMYSLGKT
mmetsp:Transcript_29778/g.60444  ORF Transcript_29778/g.60444 Transcript_29778/m.60444 type:complete len:183 (+) Transcript_29778:363-911(+)